MRIVASVLLITVLLSLCACRAETEQANPVIDAYKQSAQDLISKGDTDSAIAALEEGVQKTNDAELIAMLEDLKKQTAESTAEELTESSVQEPTESTAEEPTEESTEPTTEEVTEIEIEPDVITAYEYDMDYTSIDIPEIVLPYPEVEQLNREIYDWVYEISEYGYVSASYEWHLNGDILSLIIHTQGNSYETYDAYNVSVSTGRVLSNDDILASFDMTREQYLQIAAEAIGTYFGKEYRSWEVNYPAEFEKVKELTVAEENIAESILFVGEHNKLSAVVYIYALAGPDGVDAIVEIT